MPRIDEVGAVLSDREQAVETVIGIVVLVLAASIPAIYHFRRRRRDERSVRIWVDEHHYALLSLHGPKGWHMLQLPVVSKVPPGTENML